MEGRGQQLFDDVIEPSAVGGALELSDPAADPLLRPRADFGELVARVGVSTVTRGKYGSNARYFVTLQVLQLLRPAKWNTTQIELVIGPESPAFPLVRSLESRLSQYTFVAFVYRFAGQEGPATHFHLTKDAPAVVEAITGMAALDELRQ